MKVKTSELEGAALGWAVAKAASVDVYDNPYWGPVTKDGYRPYRPFTDWSQGGPLIEQCSIAIVNPSGTTPWIARGLNTKWMEGSTPLIAAMRAIVAAEIGDTVDVPEELTQ